MKNLFDPARVEEIKQRIAMLRPESERQWGTMTAPQAVEHCSRGLEMALGERKLPRELLGRILGPIIKPKVFANDEPMRRNSPTSKALVVQDERNLAQECARLCGMIDRFAAAGPAGCTSHPHSFFGKLKAEEWAILMYKHLDHHLRQFGV